MSLYERMTEKITLVLDIGAAYTKFGFAGEFSPRCIIPSKIKSQKTGDIRKLVDFTDKQDLYDMLVDFLYTIFMQYGLISPKDRSIIIVESLLCTTLFRETLAKALFSHFEAGSVVWLPSHLVCLSTLATDTALVVDMGYEEVVVIPVYKGVPVLKAWQALPIGAKAIHNNLKTLLKIESLDESKAEDIKVRTCFVTNLTRAQQFELNQPPEPCPSVEYPLQEADNIVISGKVRETAYEVLFDQDNECLSTTTMILNAILACGVDMRKPLAENILIVGGTAQAPGLKSRVKEELHFYSKTGRYKNDLFLKEFKFHSAPAKENYTAWLGGAIYGVTDIINMQCLTKEKYIKDKRVPDWSNLLDNCN